MTWLAPQGRGVQPPQTSAYAQPFWDGCRRSELRFQRCADCFQVLHTPSGFCAACGGRDPRWETSQGFGAIRSFTVIHRPVSPEFQTPYCPVIVRFDEGWDMISNLVNCELERIAIGMRVRTTFHEIGDGFVLPYVEPAGPSADDSSAANRR